LSIRRSPSALLLALLALAPAAREARGEPAAAGSDRRDRIFTIRLPAPEIARGPIYAQPPSPHPPVPPPAGGRWRPSPGEGGRGGGRGDGGEGRAGAAVSETPAASSPSPSAFVLLRDSSLSAPAGFNSAVDEPNVGSQGDGILNTHDWYAEVSVDNGASFSYISPYTTFPSSPSAFSAGFCCGQRVTQDSSRNLIFWLLQYVPNGSTSTSTNGDRLAIAHGRADLATDTWAYYDLTPAGFGLTGKFFDAPQMQASADDLYVTTNIFYTANRAFYGALIARMPLAQLAAGGSVGIDAFLTTSYGSLMAVHGAAAEGTRPGRTTMYFASVATATSLKVLTWDEASAAPVVHDVTGLAGSSFARFACTGPDGLDPCAGADARAQTGWITDAEMGIMWASAQNGPSRPWPYTRVVILDPGTLAVTSQPDLFSTASAWLYPAIAVDERDHLGGTIDNLGGNVYPTIRAILRDDLSPDPAVSGWETFPVAASDSGSGLWGNYNGATPHQKYPNTWLASGHTQSGGNPVTHNYWFGRARDTQSVLTVSPAGTGTGTVTSSPAGIDCGAACSTAYDNGTAVTLAPTPAASSNFTGWSGACSGTGSCVVTVDAAKSVTATFTLKTYTLTVSKAGTGSGTVTSSPSGISCGAACSADYDHGTPVTLTAAPDALTSTFAGWSGACTGTGSCAVTVDAAKSVMATFGLQAGIDYYTVQPCRLLDTRGAGQGGPLVSGAPRVFTVAGACGIPADTVAISVNVTVVTPPGAGYVTLYPGNGTMPLAATLTFKAGITLSNNAVAALASDASGTLGAQSLVDGGGGVDLVIDVVGYFR
jgi:Divergent InlB B-repeat domain